ncbi:MAG: VIT1/CCC1 transporter family protein [Candidatus Kerfeldbacteria bacterium]|nr:VIT1/CCC1 transporter family protein [Candidatus Kerfeldbacteria bacterium]
MRVHRVRQRSRLVRAMYIRNVLFGGEDSLVSTVGLLSGIAAAGSAQSAVILTGVVLIFVEALSMAVGSFLSENSAEEYLAKAEVPARDAVIGGVLMFFSYFLLGLIPLGPYLIFDVSTAFWFSIALSTAALFGLGLVSGTEFRVHPFKTALRMAVLGGSAIAIGVAVGQLVT